MPAKRRLVVTSRHRPHAARPAAAAPRPAERGGAARPPAKATAAFRGLVATEIPAAEKIEVIRRGVAARIVDDMVEYLAVPKNLVLRVLQLPESTAHRLIKEDRRLDPAASERVLRVADVTRHAEATLGGRDAAAQWLTTPNRGLAGAAPLAVLDTEAGAAEVRRILSAIDHGGVF
jgi:putative toxin-antitoxin system antitoxin component (TIGR02293 family)